MLLVSIFAVYMSILDKLIHLFVHFCFLLDWSGIKISCCTMGGIYLFYLLHSAVQYLI